MNRTQTEQLNRAVYSLLVGVFVLGTMSVFPETVFSIERSDVVEERRENVQRDSIAVPEMQCGMCEMRIEKALKKIEGVVSYSADAETDIVIVVYNTKLVTRGEIERAIANVGYDAGDIKASREVQEKLHGCCQPN